MLQAIGLLFRAASFSELASIPCCYPHPGPMNRKCNIAIVSEKVQVWSSDTFVLPKRRRPRAVPIDNVKSPFRERGRGA